MPYALEIIGALSLIASLTALGFAAHHALHIERRACPPKEKHHG